MELQTIKVVINTRHGGFGISDLAWRKMIEYGHEGERWKLDDDRHNPILVRVVEELGKEANGELADLEIRHLTFRYEISDHDGWESVMGYCDY